MDEITAQKVALASPFLSAEDQANAAENLLQGRMSAEPKMKIGFRVSKAPQTASKCLFAKGDSAALEIVGCKNLLVEVGPTFSVVRRRQPPSSGADGRLCLYCAPGEYPQTCGVRLHRCSVVPARPSVTDCGILQTQSG